jgi:hypothetical protein
MFVLLEAFDAPDIELAHALVDARRVITSCCWSA